MPLNFMFPQVPQTTPGYGPGMPGAPMMPTQPQLPPDQQQKLAQILPAIVNAAKGGGMPAPAQAQAPAPAMPQPPVPTPPITEGVSGMAKLPSEKPKMFERVQKAAQNATGFDPNAKGVGGFAKNLSTFLGSGGKDDHALTQLAHMAPPPRPMSIGQNLAPQNYQALLGRPPTLGMGGAPIPPSGLQF